MSTYEVQSHTLNKIWRKCTICLGEFYTRKQIVCEDCRKADAARKLRAKKKLLTLLEGLATFPLDPKSR